MTRIDFHSNVADRLAYACRLVRKARAAQCRIVLLSRDAQQQAALDEALWTFSAADFLPHVAAAHPHATETPVILSSDDLDELPHHHVLINLSDRTPTHFARFERMFEIISSTEEDKIAGRDRYRYYKDRGYPLTHFVAQAV
jgi:DNA polymerase-3 subunit chi